MSEGDAVPKVSRSMDATRKAALAKGREQGRVVRAYLDAISGAKRRGRPRTTATIQKRLEAIDAKLAIANSLVKLQLIQEREDLLRSLEDAGQNEDLAALEERFVAVASDYAARKGIGYSAWRAVGVSPPVLERCGISRPPRPGRR